MAIECYRVGEFTADPDGRSVIVETYSRAPWNTNLAAVLSLAARSVRSGRRYDGDRLAMRYYVGGITHSRLRALLQAHTRPTVTLTTSADIAVALDFYNFPPQLQGAAFDRTGIGDLIRRAKYELNENARLEIAWKIGRYVQSHPVLKEADLVVALPGHEPGSALATSVAAVGALEVSRHVKIPLGTLERTHPVVERKGINRLAESRDTCLA